MTLKKLQHIVDHGLDLADISGCSTYTFSSESDVIKAIGELNQLYVHQRENLSNHSLTDRLASAYLQLYFTTNIPKLFKLLHLLPQSLIEQMAKVPWIDFGSGPATYTIAWYAWLSHLKKKFPPEALLVEHDSAMQAVANKVLDQFLLDEDITLVSDFSKKVLKNGTLFFGHSSNEISMDKLFEIITISQPKFLVFLEPGTPEVFKKVSELRSYLLAHNYKIHFPCLQQNICPMKNQTLNKNWCHQYLLLKFPTQVERLTQMASLRRQHSAVIFHVYERGDEKILESEDQYRVVQGPLQSKGVWTWQVCSSLGKLEWFETLIRQYSKVELSELELKVPGTMLNAVTIQKELKVGFCRVLIGKL